MAISCTEQGDHLFVAVKTQLCDRLITRLHRKISRLTVLLKKMLFKGFDLIRLKQLKPVYVTEATTFLHTCEMQERKKQECWLSFSSFEQYILLVLKEAVPKNNIPERMYATYFCFLKKHIYNIYLCLYV